MSIQSEITRITGLRNDALSAVSDMGGTVPVGAKMEDLEDAIRSIPQGGGGSITQDANGYLVLSPNGGGGGGGGATLTETNIPVNNNAISFGQSVDYLFKIDAANQELYLSKMDVFIDELNTEITLQCGWTYDDVAYFFGSDEYGTPFVADVYDIGGNLLEVSGIQDFVGNPYWLFTVINFKWYTLE